ncbi:MAG TPA: 50S ribosomal protein L9 [Candidatus Acidoferrales bacterium]|nr:50S ribosomal protein L9 [Candidatus Acidoferrales bacterium]
MQIILQEDVEKLGHRGQVVEVAEGYARNYLLPRKLALPVSPGNLKQLEQIQRALAKREATEREGAQKQAGLLASLSVEFARKAGENDQMFGSVTAADISEALAAQGYTVDKRRIQLDQPIKTLGEYQVPAKLHREVTASLKVVVKRSE